MSKYGEGKSSPNKSTGRKRLLNCRQQRSLKRIAKTDRRISAAKATATLNNSLENPIYKRTVRRELYKMNLHGRVEISKPLLRPRYQKALV